MASFVTNEESIRKWLGNLKHEYDIFAPSRVSGQTVRFEKFNPEALALEYAGSLLPPKKYFLPTEEVLLTFRQSGEVFPVKPGSSKKILFGLHGCDLNSFDLLDRPMADGVKDEHYFARRERALMVGVNCIPDAHCFCNALGLTSVSQKGFDLFLTFIRRKIHIDAKTEKGQMLLEYLPEKEKASREEEELKSRFEKEREKKFLHDFSGYGELNEFFEARQEHPHWETLAEQCLSCTACTAVCPTCCCFDIFDEMNLNGIESKRVRRWDSCQLSSFAKINSGETYRKSRKERIRHRIFRKFVYLKKRYEYSFCVGCGRCGRMCPAGINIPTMMREMAKMPSQQERP